MYGMKQRILVPSAFEGTCAEIARQKRAVYLACTVWAAVVLLLEWLYLWQYFYSRIGCIGAVLTALFLLGIYPMKKGLFRIWADAGWEGQVREIKKKSYIHFRNLWGGRAYSGMTTRFEGHLHLYAKKKRAPWLEKHFPIRHKFILRDGGDELVYRAGDFVRKYHGCAYPIIVRRGNEMSYPPRVCVFCGKAEEDRSHTHCDFCEQALIELPETVNFVEYGMES